MTSSNFTNNTAIYNGGAIYNCKYCQNFTVFGSNFTNDTAKDDGGAIYNNGTNFTVFGSIFMNNNAGLRGGAIWNGGTGFTVSGSHFMNNTAKLSSSGGGCAVWDEGHDINVVNSTCDDKEFIFLNRKIDRENF